MSEHRTPDGGAMRVVVVGTGTGVGKTHVSCSLLAAARARGLRCIGLKPVETGVPENEEGEDGGRLRALGSGRLFHVKHPAPYRFGPPISPHLAARQAGVVISIDRIRDYVLAAEGAEAVLLETAGGLFSPLGEGLTNWDVVKALEPCRVVLVAADRLGVLHDAAATLGLADARGRGVDLVVLSAPPKPDASTGANAEELERLGTCEVTTTFPREEPEGSGSLRAAESLWARLERPRAS